MNEQINKYGIVQGRDRINEGICERIRERIQRYNMILADLNAAPLPKDLCAFYHSKELGYTGIWFVRDVYDDYKWYIHDRKIPRQYRTIGFMYSNDLFNLPLEDSLDYFYDVLWNRVKELSEEVLGHEECQH